MGVKPRRFNFNNIVGISREQLQQHYQLYLGYIRLLNNILSALEEDQTSYEYRGLKEGETYALDGIVLHELYFSNLGQSIITEPDTALLNLINRSFGNYETWLNDFLRTGNAARGWSILAYHHRDRRLHNIMQDAHNVGAVWDAAPLLVLDVYEHAYMIDFGIDKERYLEIFSRNIDWSVVNERFYRVQKYI